jgi:hypothetical protein
MYIWHLGVRFDIHLASRCASGIYSYLDEMKLWDRLSGLLLDVLTNRGHVSACEHGHYGECPSGYPPRHSSGHPPGYPLLPGS